MRTSRLCLVMALSVLSMVGAGAGRASAEAMAHWTFDTLLDKDKETFGDTVGPNGHVATPENKGSLKFMEGDVPFNKAAQFNGNGGGHLDINPLAIQSRSFTVMTWFKVESAGLNPFLSDWKKGEIAYFFGVDNSRDKKPMLTAELRSGEMRLDSKGKPTTSPHQIARVQKGEVKLNEWQHAAYVWDRTGAQAGTLTLYLNGEEVGSQDVKVGGNNQPKSVNLKVSGEKVRIGGRMDGNAVMKGALDEVWVFNEALTAEQIGNMMRTNNTRGEGAIAKVLIKKEEPRQIAKANPDETQAAAKADPVKADPVKVDPVKVDPATAVAVAPTPTPAPTQEVKPQTTEQTPVPPTPSTPSTPTPAVAEKGPAPTPAAPENSVEPVAATPVHDTPKTPVRTLSAGPNMASVTASRYTPGRLAGIVTCFTLAAGLGGFMIWAMGERAKAQGHRG